MFRLSANGVGANARGDCQFKVGLDRLALGVWLTMLKPRENRVSLCRADLPYIFTTSN